MERDPDTGWWTLIVIIALVTVALLVLGSLWYASVIRSDGPSEGMPSSELRVVTRTAAVP
jgi:hypothetical protein